MAALQYWFFIIMKSAYDYIKEKRLGPTNGVIVVHRTEQVYIPGKSSADVLFRIIIAGVRL